MSKILIVASYSAPYGGNFIASVKAFGDIMLKDNHSIVFALPKDTKEIEWAKKLQDVFPVYYIDKPYKSIELSIVAQLKDIIKKENVDVVYSHFTGYDMDCFFACRGKAKLVLHMHNPINGNAGNIKQKIKAIIKWRLFSHKVQVIGCASHLLDYISELGFDISNSTYVLNGIDVDRIVKAKASHSYPYRNNTTNILMHGWDPHRKGVDTAIEALNSIQSDVHLYITYVDQDTVFKYVEPLMKESDSTRITLLPAVENIMDYLEGADIFISPSRAEGSPYSLMEAIMAGKASIGTNLPGLDWQGEISALWTIDVGDAEALSKAIDEIVGLDRTDLENRINQSKTIIVEKHSSDTWADEVTKYFLEKVL